MSTAPHTPAERPIGAGPEPRGDARRVGGVLARFSSFGLGGVLFAVSAFAVWSSLSMSRLGEQAIAASLLSDHYSAAAVAVSEEELLERKYRLEPSPEVLERYAAAGVALMASLDRVGKQGSADDAALADHVRAAHGPYRASVHDMFEAVDRGDEAEVRRIDSEETDPRFDVIEVTIKEAALTHRAAALSSLEQLRQQQSAMSRATQAVFLIGLVLAVLFSSVLRRTRHQLDRHRDRAVHGSLHDALTGLPNRTLLADRFDQALRSGRRDGSITGLLFMDLDRFKEVNDTLGHRYGDLLLAQVAARLAGTLREVDTIARLGGDEFAVLLPGVDGAPGALLAAERLRQALAQPFELDGVALEVEASIGVVISGEHGHDSATLMQRADMAMYAAKKQGRGVLSYAPEFDQHSPERLALLGDLRRGIERGELFLHFQPKLNLRSGEVTGVEALVRWQHPQRGLVRPDEFIPFAEHTGLIGPLTRCVLNLALAQVKAWSDAGHRIPVAVNISARSLIDDQLVGMVAKALENHSLDAGMLVLEITESAVMLEPERSRAVLQGLHALGVRIAIDDFGAGYTSLAQLKQLPISELKVDKSFVLNMHGDKDDALIVRSVVELGHNLGLDVVAEGVENAESVSALAGYRCDTAQGFHLCRPQTAEVFMRWFSERAGHIGMAAFLPAAAASTASKVCGQERIEAAA